MACPKTIARDRLTLGVGVPRFLGERPMPSRQTLRRSHGSIRVSRGVPLEHGSKFPGHAEQVSKALREFV